jgi:hypothetical protein
MFFNVLRDQEVTGDPAGAKAPRRLQDLPAESECPERKSTATLKLKEAALKDSLFYMVKITKIKGANFTRLPFMKEHICE